MFLLATTPTTGKCTRCPHGPIKWSKANYLRKRKTVSVGDIDKALTETHSKKEVAQFKSYVRTTAVKHLDLTIPYDQQDAKKRKRFKQEMIKHDHKICQYVMQWPVDAYVSIWGNFRRWKVATTKKVIRASKRNIVIPSKHRKSSRRAGIIEFVGKPPPGCRLVMDSDSDSSMSEVEERKKKGRVRHNASVTKTCDYDCSLVSQSLSNYPVACPFCGYLPPIPSTIQEKLNKIFMDIPHVIPRLAMNGLVHDRHLEMLSQWKECDRQEFCDHLPRHLLTPLDIILITDIIVKQSPKGNEAVAPNPDVVSPSCYDTISKSSVLPWPDVATKQRLLNSPSLLLCLQEAMQLDDNQDLFKKIIALADHYGRQFLEHYEPYAQASSLRLKKAVDLITEKEESLLRYEDQWPVRFYLQRKANDLRRRSKQANTAPAYDKGDSRPCLSSQSTRRTLFNCPVHLSPDINQVSPEIIDFLTNRGMEELLAVIISIGVKTDEQFSRFRTLTQQQRMDVINKASPKLDTNLFQLMFLKAAFRRVSED